MDSVTYTTRTILIGSFALAIGMMRTAPSEGMAVSVIVGMLAIILAGAFESQRYQAYKHFCVLLATAAMLVCISIVPFALYQYAHVAELRVVAVWRYGLFIFCTIVALVAWLLVSAGMKNRVRSFFLAMHWHVQEC